VHSEDAVVVLALLVVACTSNVACAPKGPSPPAALEGDRARGGRDGRDGGRRANADDDDEEDEREDLAAVDAGISLRALSCENDRMCLTHRCDVEHKRCRFPCRDDSDCQKGAHCAADAGALAACFTPRPPR
jgi:hypothetical protein